MSDGAKAPKQRVAWLVVREDGWMVRAFLTKRLADADCRSLSRLSGKPSVVRATYPWPQEVKRGK